MPPYLAMQIILGMDQWVHWLRARHQDRMAFKEAEETTPYSWMPLVLILNCALLVAETWITAILIPICIYRVFMRRGRGVAILTLEKRTCGAMVFLILLLLYFELKRAHWQHTSSWDQASFGPKLCPLQAGSAGSTDWLISLHSWLPPSPSF